MVFLTDHATMSSPLNVRLNLPFGKPQLALHAHLLPGCRKFHQTVMPNSGLVSAARLWHKIRENIVLGFVSP